MPGPPPTPSYLKLLRGNPGKRRIPPEPEPALAPDCPSPPDFIVGYAADEWWRTAPELWRLGLLRVTDTACLAAYCYAYGQWRTAAEALARMAATDPHMAGLLIRTTTGDARRNPLIKVVRDAANDMVAYAGQFGLTPVARSRLAAGIDGQPAPGKFDGFLA
jgi:P27 family predicted phage terminase small subunit